MYSWQCLTRAGWTMDLVRDVAEVLTSFGGRHPARNWADEALRCTAWGVGPANPRVVS